MESRKYLSAKGLLNLVCAEFQKINSPRTLLKKTSNPIKLVDCLMSGLAMFGMKFPSLLQFEEQAKKGGLTKRNLRTLYQVDQVPSDTYLRERLDELDPRNLRTIFKTIFSNVQRGKVLEAYSYLDGYYLMPMDMTGFFSSPTIHCKNCCVKQHNRAKLKFAKNLPSQANKSRANTYILHGDIDTTWRLFHVNRKKEIIEFDIKKLPMLEVYLKGRSQSDLSSLDIEEIKAVIEEYHNTQHKIRLTYHHNMMCAAIVHPDIKAVIPFAPEPVLKADGARKNDCEQKSAKRLIEDIRREHPHLKLIVVQDALGATCPNLQELQFADMRFIVGVKPDRNKELFKLVNDSNCQTYEHITEDKKSHRYRYINGVSLNQSGLEVNFLEYWETDKKGFIQHFSWVSDIKITDENVYQIMKGGRANWRIENDTFNTIKNQGYHFSHNFGHGYQHLCSVFGMLMMLAFFIDQVQEHCCALFKNARKKFRTKKALWVTMKSLFLGYSINSWEDLFNAIANGYKETELIPNTS